VSFTVLIDELTNALANLIMEDESELRFVPSSRIAKKDTMAPEVEMRFNSCPISKNSKSAIAIIPEIKDPNSPDFTRLKTLDSVEMTSLRNLDRKAFLRNSSCRV